MGASASTSPSPGAGLRSGDLAAVERAVTALETQRSGFLAVPSVARLVPLLDAP